MLFRSCWPGHKPVPGKKPYSPGSCVKEGASAAAIAAATAIAKKKSGDYDSKGFRKTKYKNPDAPNVKSNAQRRKELDENKSGDHSLHDWFKNSKSSDGKPGWVQLGGKYAGKSCAKQPGQTSKPKCGSSKMFSSMSKKEKEAATRRKRREDPNANRSGKAINVATEEYMNEDACTTKVKSRYSVWPSAYEIGRAHV